MTTASMPDAEEAAALLLLRKRIQETADPVDLASYLTQLGEFVLSRLGFEMTEQAAASIDIGTDEHPDEARITLTWPLPETAPTTGKD